MNKKKIITKTKENEFKNKMMKIKIFILLAIYCILSPECIYADEFRILRQKNFTTLYETPLNAAAKELADIYPETKEQLENIFGWKLDLEPSIMLVGDRNRFRSMSGNSLIVAFAVPRRNLIVIDYSKMNTHPFNLQVYFPVIGQ